MRPALTRVASCPKPIRWEKTTAVAVKIKLKRLGKIRAPYYRIVVADSRTKRDGRAIEEIGKYHPKAEPSLIEVDSERAQHWLKVGAQPTDPVRKILEVTGDWQKFKGLAGAEGTLRTAEPKADKKDAFAAAVAESLHDSGAKTKARGKVSDTKPSDTKAGAASTTKADKPAKAERPARGKKADEKPAAAEEPPAEAAAEASEEAQPAAEASEEAQPAAEASEEAQPAAEASEEAQPAADGTEAGTASADGGETAGSEA